MKGNWGKKSETFDGHLNNNYRVFIRVCYMYTTQFYGVYVCTEFKIKSETITRAIDTTRVHVNKFYYLNGRSDKQMSHRPTLIVFLYIKSHIYLASIVQNPIFVRFVILGFSDFIFNFI